VAQTMQGIATMKRKSKPNGEGVMTFKRSESVYSFSLSSGLSTSSRLSRPLLSPYGFPRNSTTGRLFSTFPISIISHT